MALPTVFISKQEYDQIDECKCGGPVFKFHNTSNNSFIAKCGYFKKIIEINKESKWKIWITPKKTSCEWRVMYAGMRPVFKEINKILVKSINISKKNIHEQLEEKLKVLFKFLHVSSHSSTLNEIDILVKNNLIREPRLTFYQSDSKLISHYESFVDYEKRIFSKKIIDIGYTVIIPKIDTSIIFVDSPFLHRNTEITPRTPSPTVNKNKKKNTISQFVEIESESEETDEETDKEIEQANSETESRQDTEEDFDRDQSDFESVFDEILEETEEVDDDSPDYYDD